jgi:Protein of unknown function (DUF4231)
MVTGCLPRLIEPDRYHSRLCRIHPGTGGEDKPSGPRVFSRDERRVCCHLALVQDLEIANGEKIPNDRRPHNGAVGPSDRMVSARSEGNQRRYKTLKITVIILAALIPLLSGLDIPYIAPTGVPKSFLGLLGALIAIIEGLQQVNQHHATWISYRSTAEALKRERFLYLGKAGPYLAVPDARILLAERVEGIVSQERANWFASQKIEENKVEKRG